MLEILSDTNDSVLRVSAGLQQPEPDDRQAEPHQRRSRRWWPGVAAKQWNDWHWQQANRIVRPEQLPSEIVLTDSESSGFETADFRFAVTPYYLSLIDPADPKDPIRSQVIPKSEERLPDLNTRLDPLAEEPHSPVPGLVHRYPDRALLYTSHNCPVYCRYCFRKRKVGDPTSAHQQDTLLAAIQYIADTPQIKDVLVSGGDPLSLSDARLFRLLQALRKIKHVGVIRLATRNPVTLPQRITLALAEMLRSLHPIYISTHFNHPNECTEEAALALQRLADAGCVLNNQMVLLRDINDDVSIVRQLNRWLVEHRTQPYYIFQCDPAPGTAHFRTPIRKGLEIIEGLRGSTSGLCVPHYVVDLPGGGGKVSLQPDYVVSQQGHRWRFRNYQGRLFDVYDG